MSDTFPLTCNAVTVDEDNSLSMPCKLQLFWEDFSMQISNIKAQISHNKSSQLSM